MIWIRWAMQWTTAEIILGLLVFGFVGVFIIKYAYDRYCWFDLFTWKSGEFWKFVFILALILVPAVILLIPLVGIVAGFLVITIRDS